MGLLTNLAASYTTSSSYIKPTTTAGMDGDIVAIVAIIFTYGFIFLFIFAFYYIATALLMGSLFKKAGVKSTTSWIPFYRYYKFLQLGGQNGRLIFLSVGAIAAYIIGGILLAVSVGATNFAMMPVAILLITLGSVADIIYYIFRVIASYNLTKKLNKDPVITLFYVISEFIWWAVMLADKNTKFDDKQGAKRLDK